MSNRFSIVILPFLKTSGPVSLGGVTFRSTDDTDGLPEDQAAAVQELSRMLFVQDDLRIKVASYAVVPFVELDRAPHDTEQLENIQSVLASIFLPTSDLRHAFSPFRARQCRCFHAVRCIRVPNTSHVQRRARRCPVS